ncbi:Reverse gyrase [Candidatus Methanobinarius endosymbioticus]|uniref:DNA topoisomerase 1 n=1 Tax=Candidatus Methanobinarius endosymbioticus TaxID=2006182 RepID=A0A366MB75_9EURY|nr:Reverse gyrase [Candidatus Methanobinarius endosymbioticus]
MHEVIICEKPKSAEKIAQALSPNPSKMKYGKKVNYWEIDGKDKKITIISAVGHLYSLTPKNQKEKVYFDLKWVPSYETQKNLNYVKDYVYAIKKLGKGADKYIHACDYDIEGTLIGFNALKYACGENSVDNTTRMKFSTLTKKDLLEAYNNQIELDINQVDGGIARHIVDFYFGVNISKALTGAVRKAKYRYLQLSAGRVQTPTLSILVDREKEIGKFVPEPYCLIKALLDIKSEKEYIIADYVDGKIFDSERAEKIFENCQGADSIVDKVKITETIRKPPIPFNLGGLQSESHTIFGFSPKKTQTIAQNLYTEGYTSYPRTSSQKLPESLEFDKIFKQLSASSTFKKHIDELPQKTKPNEGKKSDAAHPAIHSTGIIPKNLDVDSVKIYELITYRFISVFAENSKLETLRVDINVDKEKFFFKRKRVSEMGWLAHYPFRKLEEDSFPSLKKGDKIKVNEILSEEKETKPPARYNEASLIKELEKRELGTKTTRADIIAKLYDRKYISGKKIEVNQLGLNIIANLREYCKNLTNEELTRGLEKELEGIMGDTISKDKVIENAKKEVLDILSDIDKNTLKIGEGLYTAYQESRVVGKCACGGNLVVRFSPKTKSSFVGCSNYPDCNIIYSLPKNAEVLKTKCEKCGLPTISFGRGKSKQRACLDPKCGVDHSKIKEPEIVGQCPVCGKDLLKRQGRYGEFIGCSGFPQCKFSSSLEDLEEKLAEKSEN